MSEDLTDAIETDAQGPRRVRGDSGEVEQQSLPDQIAADKHVRGSRSLKNPKLGLKFFRISPPGTV